MTIQGIAHVQVSIPPAGEQEARRFYGDLLGLEEIPGHRRFYAEDPFGNRIEVLQALGGQ